MDVCASKVIDTLASYIPREKTEVSAMNSAVADGMDHGENVLDSYITNFFKDCTSEFQDACVLRDSLKNNRIYFKHLGLDVYVLISVFQKNISVQIRKFVTSSSDELVPTREGLTFHLKSWYEFVKKIFGFSLRYRDSSFVCGNSIVVLSAGDNMLLLDIRSSRRIVLNACHLSLLSEILQELNDKLLTFLYENYLPGLISELCVPDPLNKDDELLDEVRLCAHLEKQLSAAMQDAYFCRGCSIGAAGQRSHDCIMRSELEKYQHVGSLIFLLIDYPQLAMDYVKDNSNITLIFLMNMTFSRITDVVYKTM